MHCHNGYYVTRETHITTFQVGLHHLHVLLVSAHFS